MNAATCNFTGLVTPAMVGMDKGWLGKLSNAEQAMLVELLEKVAFTAPAEE